MTILDKVQQFFKDNKEGHHLFATSDGFLFLLKKDAQNHAQTLEDSSVEEFSREVEGKVDTPDESEGETNKTKK